MRYYALFYLNYAVCLHVNCFEPHVVHCVFPRYSYQFLHPPTLHHHPRSSALQSFFEVAGSIHCQALFPSIMQQLSNQVKFGFLCHHPFLLHHLDHYLRSPFHFCYHFHFNYPVLSFQQQFQQFLLRSHLHQAHFFESHLHHHTSLVHLFGSDFLISFFCDSSLSLQQLLWLLRCQERLHLHHHHFHCSQSLEALNHHLRSFILVIILESHLFFHFHCYDLFGFHLRCVHRVIIVCYGALVS